MVGADHQGNSKSGGNKIWFRLSTALYFFVLFRSMSSGKERRENGTPAQNGWREGVGASFARFPLRFSAFFALKNREAVDSLDLVAYDNGLSHMLKQQACRLPELLL